MSLSKWPHGNHIGFWEFQIRWYGFRNTIQVCFGISISNFMCMFLVAKQKPIDFQPSHFQNCWLAAILDFFGFRALTLVLALNVNSKTLVAHYMCFLVETYWIWMMSDSKCPSGGHVGYFGFQTLAIVWPLVSTPNFVSTLLISMGRSIWIMSDIILKMAAWPPYWIFFVCKLLILV